MIANSAFLAAMVAAAAAVLAAGPARVPGAVQARSSSAGYLWVDRRQRSSSLFLNLFALFYLAGRGAVPEGHRPEARPRRTQLQTPDTVVRDLSERLAGEE